MRTFRIRQFPVGLTTLFFLLVAGAPAVSQDGDSKLPSAVASRLRQAADKLVKAEAELGKGGTSAADRTLVLAERLLAEIERQYAAVVDHPEVKAVRERARVLRGKVDAAKQAEAEAAAAAKARAEAEDRAAEEARLAEEEAKRAAGDAAWAKKEADSKPWVERLGPYAAFGDPRHFQAGVASRIRYEELKKLFEEYRQASFPSGKTGRLEMVEEQIARELAEWPKREEQRIARLSAEAADKLAAAEEHWVKWAEHWPEKAKLGPAPAMDADQLRTIEESVDRLAEAQPEHADLEGLRARLAAVHAENDKRLEANLKSKVMGPDRYRGADAEEIRTFASSVLVAKVPAARPLRVTIQSEDWEIESVDEWTDNTRSAVRHRETRFLWAQVASREGEQAFVYSACVAQDRQADGSWGKLYGHTTWRNRILEENVGK